MEINTKEVKHGNYPQENTFPPEPSEPPRYPGPPAPRYYGPAFPSFVDSPSSNIQGHQVITSPNGQSLVVVNTLGIEPVVMTCPFCNEQMATRIERRTWFRTHCCAGALCLLGCFLCAWIPYITHTCKKAIHYCSKCDSYIGTQL